MASVEELAFARWSTRGCPLGDDWSDWFAAEAQQRAMSQDADDPDDADRYVEYLQRESMADGWEEVFDGASFTSWVGANRDHLSECAAALLPTDPDVLVRAHEDIFLSFSPTTR